MQREEIARSLQAGNGTVHRDLEYLRQQDQEILQKHNQDRIPEDYGKYQCLDLLNILLNIMLKTYHQYLVRM